MNARLAVATLLAVAGLLGCDNAVVTEHRFAAFGTDIRLEIRAGEPAQTAGATSSLQERFRVAERDWYAFGTGELARVNERLARGQPAAVSAELAPLITRALDFYTRSGALFDPGVCALVRLWQFDSETALAAATGPPAPAALQALQARQGTLADARFDGQTLSATRPLCIDLGGMAKGTALEQARQILGQHGIHAALVDIGGSSQLALGRNGSRAWFIGLKDPRAERVIGRLALASGEAASTSGDYERGYTRDAELADAASTALMVAGPERFLQVSAALKITAALLITPAGELLTTPEMAARLRQANNGRLPRPVATGQGPDL
ncbi:MAG: FAD:protein FMN transferase [Gammaproteobacteria bacterium]|nr:FAD:protein FMN transferase [Gammaproteobacteria bacterium]